jgi:hypothetical protein
MFSVVGIGRRLLGDDLPSVVFPNVRYLVLHTYAFACSGVDLSCFNSAPKLTGIRCNNLYVISYWRGLRSFVTDVSVAISRLSLAIDFHRSPSSTFLDFEEAMLPLANTVTSINLDFSTTLDCCGKPFLDIIKRDFKSLKSIEFAHLDGTIDWVFKERWGCADVLETIVLSHCRTSFSEVSSFIAKAQNVSTLTLYHCTMPTASERLAFMQLKAASCFIV